MFLTSTYFSSRSAETGLLTVSKHVSSKLTPFGRSLSRIRVFSSAEISYSKVASIVNKNSSLYKYDQHDILVSSIWVFANREKRS